MVDNKISNWIDMVSDNTRYMNLTIDLKAYLTEKMANE
jgi:hypothetical protein